MQDREQMWSPELHETVDRELRRRCANWADWQHWMREPKPKGYPNPQPMFKEYRSKYVESELDEDTPTYKRDPDVDDAEYIESLISQLDPHYQSVLFRYYVLDQTSIKSGKRLGMSERKFNQWLSKAMALLAIELLIDMQIQKLEKNIKKRA